VLLRAGSDPRAVHWARGVSCGGCNEFVRCRTKRTVCTKGNGLEANVEALDAMPKLLANVPWPWLTSIIVAGGVVAYLLTC
jgi:hypothetical protein